MSLPPRYLVVTPAEGAIITLAVPWDQIEQALKASGFFPPDRYAGLIAAMENAVAQGLTVHLATRATCAEHIAAGDDKATEPLTAAAFAAEVEAGHGDHLLAVLTEWAEGEEGEGCRWCMFSEGHEEGCAPDPVATPALDVERLAGALTLWEANADPNREDVSSYLGADIYENGARTVAEALAAAYAEGQPVAEDSR